MKSSSKYKCLDNVIEDKVIQSPTKMKSSMTKIMSQVVNN